MVHAIHSKPGKIRWMGFSTFLIAQTRLEDQQLSKAPHDHCLVSLQEASLNSLGQTAIYTTLHVCTFI